MPCAWMISGMMSARQCVMWSQTCLRLKRHLSTSSFIDRKGYREWWINRRETIAYLENAPFGRHNDEAHVVLYIASWMSS